MPGIPSLDEWPKIVYSGTHPITQFICLDGRRQLIGAAGLHLLAEAFLHVAFSPTVREFGVTLDQELSFSQHVNLIRRSCC